MLNNIIKISIFIVLCLVLYKYFDEIGIFFIENILVIDVATLGIGAVATSKSVIAKKTFMTIIKKIGYKKFFISIFWVIIKRYLIETTTNYFKKHSFKRFKHNFVDVLKLKVDEIKQTSFVKKIIAIISVVTGSTVVYFIFTNYLSKIIIGLLQKFFYAIILIIWKFFAIFLGIFIFLFSSIIQLFFIVKIINYIEKFKIVKLFYKLINKIFKKILGVFDYFLGTKLHLSLIRISKNLDEYFASILDKNFSPYERIQRKRDRFINGIEYISIKREKYKQQKLIKEKNILKTYDKQFKKYILKRKTWREKREEYYKQLDLKKEKIGRKIKKKTIRKNKLLLPDKTKISTR